MFGPLIRHVRVWDAEGRCAKGHLHFARSQDSAAVVRKIVNAEIKKCAAARALLSSVPDGEAKQ